MHLGQLLFSTRGRINRLQYWMGSFAVGMGALLALALVIAMHAPAFAGKTSKEAALGALLAIFLWLIPIIAIGGWCQTAIQIKRLHDRGRSWLFALLPWGVNFLSMASAAGGAILLVPVVLIISLGVSVWMFVELGCLPGKPGPNRFGDPPAGAPKAAPAPMPATAPNLPMRSAPSAMASAELAMERAIAAQARSQPPRPLVAAPAAAGFAPSHAAPSFGRKPAC